MKNLSKEDFDDLQKFYRINLINSCTGYKSANLIGSISKDGVENVAVFSSITHLGSNPAMLGYILRPTTVPRNTYKNIKETGLDRKSTRLNSSHSSVSRMPSSA